MHVYEGHNVAELAVPIRAFKAAGIDILTLTNASGLHAKACPLVA